MNKNDFVNEKPLFDNGECKWHLDKELQKYLETQQAENLPSIQNAACFVVIGTNIQDYVLIDDKQNILASFNYNLEGKGQMEARINIIKISKHYAQSDKL